jgi:hypothetical protein
MDLVYIVKESEQNNDLKYSLRSVEKFVPHDKIWIVGYKPSWVTNVEYLPVKQNDTKWKNSVNNIIAACKCPDISEDFILMNDDFFAIQPIYNLKASVNLSLGLLDDAVKKQQEKQYNSNWGKAFLYVQQLLKSLKIGEPYYNYESHTPLLINKEKYLEVMNLPEVQEFMKTSKVLHKRTLYKNIAKTIPTMLEKDVKIAQKNDDTNFKKNICGWLSVYDNQVGNKNFPILNKLLKELFPEKCKYEKSFSKSNYTPNAHPQHLIVSRNFGPKRRYSIIKPHR